MTSRSPDKLRFGLWYDFRNPAAWEQQPGRLYAESLEQIVWAENNGFDYVWLSEHHFAPDGYLPSTPELIPRRSQNSCGRNNPCRAVSASSVLHERDVRACSRAFAALANSFDTSAQL